MKRYGYHIKATLADGTTDERDIITPLLTIAIQRHTGGGIEESRRTPASPMDCWTWCGWTHVPNFGECAVAISNAI